VRANFSHYWVYVVGPLAGGLLAVGFAWILRGRGGDVGGLAAARGLDDEVIAAQRAEKALRAQEDASHTTEGG
jgi:aquaporin Z